MVRVLEFLGESAQQTRFDGFLSWVCNFADLVSMAKDDNAALGGPYMLRAQVPAIDSSSHLRSASFDDTMRAMRDGWMAREVSHELRERPAGRVFFSPPFQRCLLSV